MKKNLSLSIRMGLGFSLFFLIMIMALSFLFLYFFTGARDNEIFESIKLSQEILKNKGLNDEQNTQLSQNNPSTLLVNHIGIVNRNVKVMTFTDTLYKGLGTQIIEIVSSSFSAQKNDVQKYKIKIGNANLYYLIMRSENNGIISFRIDELSYNFNRVVFTIVPILIALIVVFSFIFSFLYSRRMTKSLKKLQDAVVQIGKGNLKTKIDVSSKDEIGVLATAFEDMRDKLSEKEHFKQTQIQYLSHELKTPVMTIMGYSEAIKDDIFPKGSLHSSLDVILQQSVRLQNIINKLLTITKLDYIENFNEKLEEIDVSEVITSLCESQFANKKELFELKLENMKVNANREKLIVLIENLVENALRYCEKNVLIELCKSENGKPQLIISNDGELIDEQVLPKIFHAFEKGQKGVNGLGLSIVKRIADYYHWGIKAENADNKVVFTVLFH